MGHYSSFILRLWVEPPDGVRWGIIQHVATRDKLRFQAVGDSELAVADVIEFIRQHSAEGEITLPFVLDGSPPASDGVEKAKVEVEDGASLPMDGAEKAEVDEPQVKDEASTTESQA